MESGTTITLDDDVAARLNAEAQKTGTDLQQLANDVLRRELTEPFEIRGPFARSIPGAGSFDCIARVLDEIEGPEWK
jgi:hypothetical protein